MSKQTQQLGGGLWGNGLKQMEFARPAVEAPPAVTQSPEPLPEDAWSCIMWGQREPGRLRHPHQFAAAFPEAPVKGLCYDLQGKPIRCLHTGDRFATFEFVGGMVGGGMDRIVELAY